MADRPIRIQLSRAKGWRMPQNTVNVARGPGRIWGNPFLIGGARCSGSGKNFVEEYVKDAETAVRFFREMLTYERRPYPSLDKIISDLRGKNLACWCPLNGPCHADVLLEMANGEAR